MSKSVEDSLHSIESHLGPNSTLSQRLADCDTSYGWLKDKLGAVEPTLANLGASVEIMLTPGSNLVRQFGDFGKRLEEAQHTGKARTRTTDNLILIEIRRERDGDFARVVLLRLTDRSRKGKCATTLKPNVDHRRAVPMRLIEHLRYCP